MLLRVFCWDPLAFASLLVRCTDIEEGRHASASTPRSNIQQPACHRSSRVRVPNTTQSKDNTDHAKTKKSTTSLVSHTRRTQGWSPRCKNQNHVLHCVFEHVAPMGLEIRTPLGEAPMGPESWARRCPEPWRQGLLQIDSCVNHSGLQTVMFDSALDEHRSLRKPLPHSVIGSFLRRRQIRSACGTGD